jgi:hypothetical protein
VPLIISKLLVYCNYLKLFLGYGDRGWPEDILKGPMPVAFGCLKKFPVWDGSEKTYCEVTTEVTLIVAGVSHILNLVDLTLPKPFNIL